MYFSISKRSYFSVGIKILRFSCRNCSAGIQARVHYNKFQDINTRSPQQLSDYFVAEGNTLSSEVVELRFYLEMFNEVLCPNRYHQFIIQDIFYLQGRLKVLEIAQRRFADHALFFSGLSVGDEAELKKFDDFRSHFKNCNTIDQMNPACRNYITFLNNVVESKSLEEFIAALLSCLWIFQKIANIYAHRVDDLDCNHLYFHFLHDLKEYLTSSSMDKLLLILYSEISSKTAEEQERLIPKLIEAFMCGLEHEIEFYNSLYQ